MPCTCQADKPKQRPPPKINLFDIFLGSGRTIRRSTGPPGLPLLQAPTLRALRRPANKPATNASTPTAQPANTPPHSHVSAAKAQPSTTDEVKKDASATPAAHATAQPDNKQHNTNDVPFTPEEDTQLQQLKEQNKPWKDIAQQTGREVWQLKRRFRELKSANAPAAEKQVSKTVDTRAGTEKQAQDGAHAQQEEKAASAKHSKQPKSPRSNEGSKRKPKSAQSATHNAPPPKHHPSPSPSRPSKHHSSTRPSKPHSHTHSHPPLAPSTIITSSSPTLVLAEDPDFTPAELHTLIEIMTADNDARWDRVASRFFDVTGRRCDGEVLSGKFPDGEF